MKRHSTWGRSPSFSPGSDSSRSRTIEPRCPCASWYRSTALRCRPCRCGGITRLSAIAGPDRVRIFPGPRAIDPVHPQSGAGSPGRSGTRPGDHGELVSPRSGRCRRLRRLRVDDQRPCFGPPRPDVHLRSTFGGVADGFLWAALAWSVALIAVLGWRLKPSRFLGALAATAVGLAILYYAGDDPVGLGDQAPRAKSGPHSGANDQSPVGLIGGELANLPIRADLTSGHPLPGFLRSRSRMMCSSSSSNVLVQNEATLVSNPMGPQVFATTLVPTLPGLARSISHRPAWSGFSGRSLGAGTTRHSIPRIVLHAPGRAGDAGLVDRPADRAVPRGARAP